MSGLAGLPIPALPHRTDPVLQNRLFPVALAQIPGENANAEISLLGMHHLESKLGLARFSKSSA